VVAMVGAGLDALSGPEVRHEERRGDGERILCRMCVQMAVNQSHLLEDKRECIRGGVESRVR
jgi:hypothetical protein